MNPLAFEQANNDQSPALSVSDKDDTTTVNNLADKYEKVKLAGSGSYGEAWVVKRSLLSINAEETELVATGAGKKQIQDAEKRFFTRSGHRKKFIAKEIILDSGDGNVQKLLKRTQRASAEVKVLSRLRHPNIVAYVEEINEWDRMFIIMEYAAGGDLKNLCRKKRKRGEHFSEPEILSYFTQLCMGLKHIHGCSLLHRDIKPANLFLTSDSRVIKIGDFGLTKQLTQENQQAQTICGTPANYAPEICNEQSYTAKADIWAAGCVLFEMMTLEHPWVGGSREDVFKRILSGKLPECNPKRLYSPGLCDLVNLLLQQNPALRPSAAEVLMLPQVTVALESLEKEYLKEKKKSPSKDKPSSSSSALSSSGNTNKPNSSSFIKAPSSSLAYQSNTPERQKVSRGGLGLGLEEDEEDDLLFASVSKKRKGQLSALVASLNTGGQTPPPGSNKQSSSNTTGKLPNGSSSSKIPSPPTSAPPRSHQGGATAASSSPPPPPSLSGQPLVGTSSLPAPGRSKSRSPPPLGGSLRTPSGTRGIGGGGNNNSTAASKPSPIALVREQQAREDRERKEKIKQHQQAQQHNLLFGNSNAAGTTSNRLPSLSATAQPRGGGGRSPGVSPTVSPRPAGSGGAGAVSSSDDEEEVAHQTRRFVQQELLGRGGNAAGNGATTSKPPTGARPSTTTAGGGGGASPLLKKSSSKLYGETSMSRSEFDTWLTKKVVDEGKKKKIRELLSLIPEKGASGGSVHGAPSPSGSRNGTRPTATFSSPTFASRTAATSSTNSQTLSMHKRCDIFDKCVEELADLYNQQVHMTLMSIVFR